MAILPTTTLTGEVQTFEGDPIVSGSITFTPTGVDVDAATGAIVAAQAVTAAITNGVMEPVNVYPNSAGVKGTTYKVEVTPGNGAKFGLDAIFVGTDDASLGDLILAGSAAKAAGAAKAILTTAAKYQADLTAGALTPNTLYLVKG